MSVDTTLAVLYAQSGLSTNVANAAMVAPQASLAMTRVLAAEAMRQEREKIEKMEKTDDPAITAREEGQKGFFNSRRRRRQNAADNEEKGESLISTPFLGNLLNVKV